MLKQLLNLDKRFSEAIYKLSEKSGNLAKISIKLSFGYGSIPILAFLILTSENPLRVFITLLLLVTLFYIGFEKYLKKFFRRTRPTYSLLKSYSFPSTHALSTMTLVVFYISTTSNLSLQLVVLAISYLILIGFSRIYLGFHYISDILGGWIIGIMLGIIVSFVYLLLK